MIPIDLLLRTRRWAAGCVAVISAVAIAVLGGWIFGIHWITNLYPGGATMKPLTAANLLLLSLALRSTLSARGPRWRVPARRAAVGAVALSSLASLAEHLGWLGPVANTFFLQGSESVDYRMSPATATALAVHALAFLLTPITTRRGGWPTQYLSCFGSLIGFIALEGYILDVQDLYRVQPYSTMALHTATLLFLTGLAQLLAFPDRGWMAVILSGYPGGSSTRRLLPYIVAVPLTLGWIRWKGQLAGLYGTGFGLSIVLTGTIVGLCAVLVSKARQLNRAGMVAAADQERLRVLTAELRDANRELEQRIAGYESREANIGRNRPPAPF